ncbi:hypothetical protein NH340_JMT06475 [Sarcoptes scabiei]|nr:hypothetical protein NH340_JMT06475 [Sarcoptes scabiei]
MIDLDQFVPDRIIHADHHHNHHHHHPSDVTHSIQTNHHHNQFDINHSSGDSFGLHFLHHHPLHNNHSNHYQTDDLHNNSNQPPVSHHHHHHHHHHQQQQHNVHQSNNNYNVSPTTAIRQINLYNETPSHCSSTQASSNQSLMKSSPSHHHLNHNDINNSSLSDCYSTRTQSSTIASTNLENSFHSASSLNQSKSKRNRNVPKDNRVSHSSSSKNGNKTIPGPFSITKTLNPMKISKKHSSIVTVSNDSGVNDVLKNTNPMVPNNFDPNRNTDSPLMTTADTLRRKKKSHLSRDELARVCQLGEVTFEPYNNSSYMIAIRSKGDRKSLIGYRCDWNHCGYMNARVERMFGHIRSQHPEAPTVKKLVTTTSSTATTTTLTTSNSFSGCQSLNSSSSMSRNRSSSSLSNGSSSSSSSFSNQSTTKNPSKSQMTTAVRNITTPTATYGNNSSTSFADVVDVNKSNRSLIVRTPSNESSLLSKPLVSSSNTLPTSSSIIKNEFLLDLLRNEDKNPLESNPNIKEKRNEIVLEQTTVTNEFVERDQQKYANSDLNQSHHRCDAESKTKNSLSIDANKTDEIQLNRSVRLTENDLDSLFKDEDNLPTNSRTLMTTSVDDHQIANKADQILSSIDSDENAQQIRSKTEPILNDLIDSIPAMIENDNAQMNLNHETLDGSTDRYNGINLNESNSNQTSQKNAIKNSESILLMDENESNEFENGEESNDFINIDHRIDSMLDDCSDNSCNITIAKDEEKMANCYGDNAKETISNENSCSHSSLSSANKKRKANNSKNYIGKQNLFQEFQSDDVAKIRDSENKYIIALQKDVKIVGYRCDWPDCEFLTCRKYVMVNHINGKHTNQRPYSCDMCNFTFVKRYFLKAHMYKVHKRRMSLDDKKDENDENSLNLNKCDFNHKWNRSDVLKKNPEPFSPDYYDYNGSLSIATNEIHNESIVNACHPPNTYLNAYQSQNDDCIVESKPFIQTDHTNAMFEMNYDPNYSSSFNQSPMNNGGSYENDSASLTRIPPPDSLLTPPLSNGCRRSMNNLDSYGNSANYCRTSTSNHSFRSEFLSPPSSISSNGSFSGCHTDQSQSYRILNNGNCRTFPSTPNSFTNNSSFYLHTPSPSPSSLSHSPAANTSSMMFTQSNAILNNTNSTGNYPIDSTGRQQILAAEPMFNNYFRNGDDDPQDYIDYTANNYQYYNDANKIVSESKILDRSHPNGPFTSYPSMQSIVSNQSMADQDNNSYDKFNHHDVYVDANQPSSLSSSSSLSKSMSYDGFEYPKDNLIETNMAFTDPPNGLDCRSNLASQQCWNQSW